MKPFSFFCSILTLALMTGCLSPDCCAPPSSNHFFVNLRNSEGSNLLDPKTEGSIDLNKTRLFLLENGEAKMVKYESPGAVLDYPYGVMSVGESGVYGVQFSFEYKGSQREVGGIIQWDEVQADTLTFNFNSEEAPTFLTKISRKGKVLWDVESDPDSEIVINLIH